MGPVQTITRNDRPAGRGGRPPALLIGGPLPDPGLTSLAGALERAAALNPGRAICHIAQDGSESWCTYAQLLDEASHTLGGIRRAGARPGDRVILHLADEHELLVAFWACVLGGFVPAPLSSRLDAAAVEAAWHTLGAPWIIGDDALGDRLSGSVEGPRAHWIGAMDRLEGSGPEDGICSEPADSDWSDVAVLMLTAGSTGEPKAVMLSHGNILSRSTGTARANGLTSHCITFNWMPLDHVSGLVMFHVRDVVAGATQIHAHKDWILADPLRWLEVIDRHRVNAIWAANSAFDLVSSRVTQEPGRTWDLSCVAYIMNGGAPIKARTIRRFINSLAPHGLSGAVMRPGWGMSETSSGVVDHRLDPPRINDDDRYVPVGVPHPGVSVRVVDDADEIVPEGTLGHLQVTGAPVMYGYFEADALNRRVFTADRWFRTGDMAFIEDDALTVTGSADDLIRMGGQTCHGHEIESAVEELTLVEASSAVACTVGDGELALFCSLTPGTRAREAAHAIRRAVRERFGLEVTHVVPMALRDIPRTPTGKPKRAQLRAGFPSAQPSH
ncbi:AMP-binding protein [Streptomyces sp. NPDC051956]|uniref:AMP-binding protein n=1 Tax=Streptomyces sp. NPDC051956 TaxID=3365677 RepID=UPI0037CE63C2